jgi:hypothetical protein
VNTGHDNEAVLSTRQQYLYTLLTVIFIGTAHFFFCRGFFYTIGGSNHLALQHFSLSPLCQWVLLSGAG